MSMYAALRKQVPASKLVPVCYAWDALARSSELSKFDLWAEDGNHASAAGTFLAANVFYFFLTGSNATPKWSIPELSPSQVTILRNAAKAAITWKTGPGI
jgi:hypothetical protein